MEKQVNFKDIWRIGSCRMRDRGRCMRKRFCSILMIVCLVVICLSGCGREKNIQKNKEPTGWKEDGETENAKKQPVELTVWGAEEDTALMEQVFRRFKDKYQDEAYFTITYEVQSESGCKDALLGGLEEGADVFAFADDQLQALAAAGAIEPIEQVDEIRGQHLKQTVEAASVGDKIYAYPLTADNGYFLCYNKEYFSQEDVQELDSILRVAADNGKLFAMDWSSAWYVYAFFGNTGLEVGLNEDGITNFCNWNGTGGEITGVAVAEAMLRIAANPGFASKTDAEFVEGVKNGTVIAGVSGVWNAVMLKEVWGENFGAAKMPCYSCDGKQVQMASFSGCKLIGVNAYSDERKWAEKLAEWITNEENQKLRFQVRGQGPSNKRAAESEEVQQSPSIAALLAQSEYSHLQRIGGNFWEPVAEFSGNMLLGNPSGRDLQEQLDVMVEKITER